MSMPTMKKTLAEPLGEVLQRIPDALAAEGFGVLSDIDVQATLKKKLDADLPGYRILGACNPKLAQRALATDMDVGVLLPCNVVVRDSDDGGTTISIVDPNAAMGDFGTPALREVATEAAERLSRVLAAL